MMKIAIIQRRSDIHMQQESVKFPDQDGLMSVMHICTNTLNTLSKLEILQNILKYKG